MAVFNVYPARKCISLASGTDVYVNDVIVRESFVADRDAWTNILFNRQAEDKCTLALSEKTFMVHDDGVISIEIRGELGMYATIRVPSFLYGNVYWWLRSLVPGSQEPEKAPEPVVPRTSPRLRTKRHKPNYRV